jgi:hypothetical protein
MTVRSPASTTEDMVERHEFLLSPAYDELDQLLLRTIKRKVLYPRSANGRNGASG